MPDMGEQVDADQTLVELSPMEDGRKRLRHDDDYLRITSKNRRLSQIGDTSCSSLEDTDKEVLLEADLHLDNFGLVTATLLPDCIVWHSADNGDRMDVSPLCCWESGGMSESPRKLSLSEIYAIKLSGLGPAQYAAEPPRLQCFTGASSHSFQVHQFVVHSFQRSAGHKGRWIPKSYVFGHTDPDVCQRWAHQLGCLLEHEVKRPKNLLVIVSPHSGKQQALKTWEKVSPLFKLAGVSTKVVKTERARHAFEIMEKATDKELKELDGVIVVGGDGLFNEVLNGLVSHRHKAKDPPMPQDIAKLFCTDSYSSNRSQHEISNSNKKQWAKSAAYAERNAESDSVSLSAAADLHPLLDNSSCLVTDGLSPTKSSLTSGHSSVFGCESGSYIVDKERTGISSPFRVMGSESTTLLESTTGQEDSFDFLSSTGAGINSSVHRKYNAEDGSNAGLSLPNPHFRIGIIPAGSTDSIAVSTTGSRDPVTSALHIILGDSMGLDIIRLTAWKSSIYSPLEEPRVHYAASFAGYGFYGDVIAESEVYRWMGPMRYDYAGTKVFLEHKSYEAEVFYLELPENMKNSMGVVNDIEAEVAHAGKLRDEKKFCCANCTVCAKGMDFSDLNGISASPLSVLDTPRWQSSRGSFLSVGAAVMSCRNDKAPNGVAAHAHLADGLLHLILIRNCSRPAYFWHLVQLTREDSNPLNFSFIEHHKTPQFMFTSYGQESIWNVDGEAFPAHQLSAQVFRGLLPFFARGPEL